MLQHGRMSSPAVPSVPAAPLNAGAVIRRLMRDYLSGQWGLLALAIFCMLLTSAIGGLVPQMVNWEIKLVFMRRQAEMLLPLSLGVAAVVGLRAVTLYFGRMMLD